MRHPLERKLAVVRSRVRRLWTLYGLSCVLSAVLLTGVALGLADCLIRFQDRGLRVMASLAVLGVLGWTAYRFLYFGLAARLGDVDLARRLQRRFPQLGEGLASAVQFVKQPAEDPTAGSAALRREVIDQTTAAAEQLDLLAAIQARPVLRAAAGAAALLAATVVLAALDPPRCRTALARLLNPFNDVAWPQVHHLQLRKIPDRVHRGEPFQAELIDLDPHGNPGRLPPELRVYYRFENPDGTTEEQFQKLNVLGNAAVIRRERVTRRFAFRVEGGDDSSMPWHPVAVVDPPAIKSLTIKLVPPAYTGWVPEHVDRDVRALVGTRLELAGEATKPLASAAFCLEGSEEVPARLIGQHGSFEVVSGAAGQLVVEKSGVYWFRLIDRDGLTSDQRPYGQIQAVPDQAPSVSIDQPATNILVTPQAAVPIQLTARDDLAIQRIDLEFSRQDQQDKPDGKLPLYRGPAQVQSQPAGLLAGADSGHRQVASYAWELAPLGLQPGTTVSFWGIAADYRPQTGKSPLRRLSVVTPEQLADHLAARQSLILAELSRALGIQRQGRQQVAASQARLEQLGQPTQPELDNLRNAEHSQREIAQLLGSRGEGVLGHALGLLADLENNKLELRELKGQMEALAIEIQRLGREPLPTIGRQLTAAIKAAQLCLERQPAPSSPPKPPVSEILNPLAAAAKAQDQVIASLERLLGDLARSESFRAFYREMGQLLRDQEELARRSAESGQRTVARELKDLSAEELTQLRLAAHEQRELARRLEAIQHQMDQAADQAQETDPLAAHRIADALDRSRQLGTSGKMRSAAEGLQRNQIGQALQEQRQVLDHLHEVLEILADRRGHGLSGLLKALAQASAELAQIAQCQEELRKQMEGAGADGADARRALESLATQQHELRQKMERTVQRLQRLTVPQAIPPARQAVDKMARAGQSAQQAQARAAALYAQQARQAVEQTLAQLEQHRRQSETQLATEQLTELHQTIQQLHRRQETALQQTRQLDQTTEKQPGPAKDHQAALAELAGQQRRLGDETAGLAARLAGAEVFRWSLQQSADCMALAAGMLERRQTGQPAQQAQQDALDRLACMLEALRPRQAEEGLEGPAGPPSQPGTGPRPGLGTGLRDVAQLRLVKSMQQKINRRTKALDKAWAGADRSAPEPRRRHEAVAHEQAGLAQLLLALVPPEHQAEDQSASPLLRIAGDMRQVETLIRQGQSGRPTQQVQQQIVEDLQQVIREGESRLGPGLLGQHVGAKPSGGKPGQGEAQPGSGPAKAGALPAQGAAPAAPGSQPRRPSPAEIRALLSRFWGSLPERQREQMLQMQQVEEFLPKYELWIEEYFRRLAGQRDRSGLE